MCPDSHLVASWQDIYGRMFYWFEIERILKMRVFLKKFGYGISFFCLILASYAATRNKTTLKRMEIYVTHQTENMPPLQADLDLTVLRYENGKIIRETLESSVTVTYNNGKPTLIARTDK